MEEHDRIKEKRAQEERERIQKADDKQKRKEDREAKKKAEELQKLKDELEEKYITSGVEAEFILGQEISDVHGSFSNQPILGLVGGPIF